MTSHVPDRGERIIRPYGFYSNASRGFRQKETNDVLIPYHSGKYFMDHFILCGADICPCKKFSKSLMSILLSRGTLKAP